MSRSMQRPDVQHVLSQLKDFQRETVDYVFRRLYLDPSPAHRFLVADEVGLGKTLVARGVIAKALEHLWDRVDRIDVVYICSNLDIARQNVSRLNAMGDKGDVAIASRITLLPKLVHQISEQKYNFVSFTPDTSFNLKSSQGMQEERLLLYCLLKRAWGITSAGAKNLLQGWVENADRFRQALRNYERDTEIDEGLSKAFAQSLEDKIRAAKASGERDIRTRFDELCYDFGRMRQIRNIPNEEKRRQSAMIGELRAVLARTCIRALEPDLVILDEFQRFKDLLDGEDEASLLARELFDYENQDGRARVLLLSATPYKMYTVQDDSTNEDHYADFLQTLKFLQNDPGATGRVRGMLDEYRRLLFRWSSDTREQFLGLKSRLEAELRKVMVRTERLSVSADRNGMLAEKSAAGIQLSVPAVRTYRALQEIAHRLEQPDATEYWKAAPFLLNFMSDYKLKQEFRAALANGKRRQLRSILEGEADLLLGPRALRGTQCVEPPHARMKWLLEDTIGRGLWKLLWIPPSLPYYELAGAFADAETCSATKRLIFSAWKVVPRAVAGLLSLEAEREMLRAEMTSRTLLQTAREGVQQLLRFTRTDGRLTGMPVLGMLYPSFVLAELGDPLRFAVAADHALPALNELLAIVRARVAEKLQPLISERARQSGVPDESWYWAAPILLDRQQDAEAALSWITRADAALRWVGLDPKREGADAENRLWRDHVSEAVAEMQRRGKLGPAPSDLIDVVALQAVAAPSICALRALGRVTGGADAYREPFLRDAAGTVAWALRNLFNLPDVTALVRMLHAEGPYWEKVLEYCAAGGLQSVLDEYAHILPESLGLIGADPAKLAGAVAGEMTNSLGLRTAPVAIDDIRLEGEHGIGIERKNLRARFAVRFGDYETDEGEERTRAGTVRSAFNSPFWPFVLATTTVGQEGLDFHHYCHAVVHWNLPSNPVDLEQREGRVHRYKGHAVRRNLALLHRSAIASATATGETDPWSAMFADAVQHRDPGASDIVPFWVLPADGGASVERHVPALPLSRDVERLESLRRTLAVYRMVFGQPRQDELLDYLLRVIGPEEAERWLGVLRMDLKPSAQSS